jgi:hypothetical protein
MIVRFSPLPSLLWKFPTFVPFMIPWLKLSQASPSNWWSHHKRMRPGARSTYTAAVFQANNWSWFYCLVPHTLDTGSYWQKIQRWSRKLIYIPEATKWKNSQSTSLQAHRHFPINQFLKKSNSRSSCNWQGCRQPEIPDQREFEVHGQHTPVPSQPNGRRNSCVWVKG